MNFRGKQNKKCACNVNKNIVKPSIKMKLREKIALKFMQRKKQAKMRANVSKMAKNVLKSAKIAQKLRKIAQNCAAQFPPPCMLP